MMRWARASLPVVLTVGSLLPFAVSEGAAQAAPACTRLILPPDLQHEQAWASRMAQEVNAVPGADSVQCAEVQVSPLDSDGARSMRARWNDAEATARLEPDVASSPDQARAGALLAHGLLMQLRAASATPPPKPAPVPVDPTEGAAQLAPPAPPTTAPEPALPASPPTARPDAPRASWDLLGSVGCELLARPFTGLAQLALSARHVSRRTPSIRLALDLSGSATRVQHELGSVWLAGPGLALGGDVATYRSRRGTLWLGPAVDVRLMVVGQHPDAGPAQRSSHATLAVGLRGSWDIAWGTRLLSWRAGISYVARSLVARLPAQTLVAYDGLLFSLGVAYGRRWHLPAPRQAPAKN